MTSRLHHHLPLSLWLMEHYLTKSKDFFLSNIITCTYTEGLFGRALAFAKNNFCLVFPRDQLFLSQIHYKFGNMACMLFCKINLVKLFFIYSIIISGTYDFFCIVIKMGFQICVIIERNGWTPKRGEIELLFFSH
jgi:hypothetical protein